LATAGSIPTTYRDSHTTPPGTDDELALPGESGDLLTIFYKTARFEMVGAAVAEP
jgi:hypothetical protein